ncbi:MAG: DUF805 domain-containing protein [Dehalococcoidia bacterium]
MSETARAGWYHGEGDPEGTVRYWNGEAWEGDAVPAATPTRPQPAPVVQDAAPAEAITYPERPAEWWARAFMTTGRINRVTALVLLTLPQVVVWTVVLLAIGVATGGYEDSSGGSGGEMPAGVAVVVLGVAVGTLAVTVWFNAATAGKRLHDLGMSAWMVLMVLIPMGGLAMAVLCFFIPGQKGANTYGEQPPPGFRV